MSEVCEARAERGVETHARVREVGGLYVDGEAGFEEEVERGEEGVEGPVYDAYRRVGDRLKRDLSYYLHSFTSILASTSIPNSWLGRHFV